MAGVSRKVVIVGAPYGQDAYLLAEYYKCGGYQVIGVGNPERKSASEYLFLDAGSPFDRVHYLDLSVKEVCFEFLDSILPIRIINAAALHANSNEMLSYSTRNKNRIHTVEVLITSNLLSWQSRNSECRFLNLNSSQIFGNYTGMMNSESPTSPFNNYSKAKLEALSLVREWKNRGLNARSAILFPHSSPYSRKTFLLQEITSQIYSTMEGKQSRIKLRNAEMQIDISDARDLMHNVFNYFEFNIEPTNCVFGSGELVKIAELVERALSRLGIEDCQIVSHEAIHQTSNFASASEMLQKTPNYLSSRDVSSTIEEMVKLKFLH